MRGVTDASAVDVRHSRVRLGTPALAVASVDSHTPKRASACGGQGAGAFT